MAKKKKKSIKSKIAKGLSKRIKVKKLRIKRMTVRLNPNTREIF